MSNVLLSLLIAVLTSAIVAYITASLLLAQKQLVAATRLQAYLFYWQSWTVHESNIFPIFYQGQEWNKQAKEILRKKSGDTWKELVELQKQKKNEFFTQIKAQIENEQIDFDRNLLAQEMRNLPKETASSILEWAKTTRQNIIDGKTFISDEEAVALGLGMTQKAVELKMGIIDLIEGATAILLSAVSTPEHFDVKNHAQQIAQTVWRGVVVSRDIDALFGYVQVFTRRSVLQLTLMNIKSGSRLRLR